MLHVRANDSVDDRHTYKNHCDSSHVNIVVVNIYSYARIQNSFFQNWFYLFLTVISLKTIHECAINIMAFADK